MRARLTVGGDVAATSCTVEVESEAQRPSRQSPRHVCGRIEAASCGKVQPDVVREHQPIGRDLDATAVRSRGKDNINRLREPVNGQRAGTMTLPRTPPARYWISGEQWQLGLCQRLQHRRTAVATVAICLLARPLVAACTATATGGIRPGMAHACWGKECVVQWSHQRSPPL